MRFMMVVSLVLNVAVLVPVCGGLLSDSAWAKDAFGIASPARQILLAVYLAIGIVSLLLLVRPDSRMIAALLLVQVIYKCVTPLTVESFKHPVVLSNLVISMIHAITLMMLWRGGEFDVQQSRE